MAGNAHGPMLDPIRFGNRVKPVIATWGQQYVPSLLGADPASEQLKRGNAGTFELAQRRPRRWSGYCAPPSTARCTASTPG